MRGTTGPRRGDRPSTHAIRNRDQGPAQGLRRRRGGARRVLLRRHRRGLLPPRTQRRRQDDDHRDPRGLPLAQRGRRQRPRPRPRARRAGAARARRHRAAGGGRAGRADGGGGPHHVRALLPAPRARSQSSSSSSGLAGKEDDRVKLLSGGQRRRLDLALALVGDPDLLFLDEPTTGFDPSARRQAWSTIKDLCALGKTVFLTTHFMDEAQALADRVAVMVDGRIVALGTPAEIGGRDTAPTEIAFALPAGVGLADLPPLDGARIAETAPGRVRVSTGDGAAGRPRPHGLGARARPRAARLRRQPAVAGGRLPTTDRDPGGHEPMTAMSETLERHVPHARASARATPP